MMRTALLSLLALSVSSQVVRATRIQASRLPSGATSSEEDDEGEDAARRPEDEDGDDRNARQRKLNYSTKVFEGVPIIVKDGEYSGERGKSDWPVTLPPRLLKDGFAIQPTKSQGNVVKTEYSTFTYFITSLEDGQTVTSTDIVVSSNVVTSLPSIEATPLLQDVASDQISSTPIVGPTSGFHLMATKTYFTTSTFYTTYIDQQRTVTKTRTNVRSKVVTESYSGGQFDYLPGPVEQTLAPSIQEGPQGPKYLSLGPNIYGLVKTFYATYTYNNGLSGESKEVITQVSTSLFSTTALPASISVSRPVEPIASTSALQLDADSLQSLKESWIQAELQPSLTATYTQGSPGGPAIQQTSRPTWSDVDNTYLSSLKESFISSQSDSTPAPTTVNQPPSAPTVVRPTPATSSTVSASSRPQPTRPSGPEKPDPPRPQPTTLKPTQSGDAGPNPISQDSVEDAGGADPSDSAETPDTSESEESGGLLGAVVGGLSNALNPQDPPAGLQVDLGPVLDAVATLLRGPIRSAIANRRNTAQGLLSEREDVSGQIAPTKTINPPQFARIPSSDPNIIPVGVRYTAAPSRDSQYGFIPLNAAQKHQQQGHAVPRIDTQSEILADGLNEIQSSEPNYDIPADILNILESSNYEAGQPITIDKDKIVINDHIIRTNDPHIIDVLNKYEHSYLYNRPTDEELKIRIAQGAPMPKERRVQPNPNDRVAGNGRKKYNGVPQLPPPPGSGPHNRPRQPPKKPHPPPHSRPGQPHHKARPPQGSRPYSANAPKNRPPPPPGKRPTYAAPSNKAPPKRPSYAPPGQRPSYAPPSQGPPAPRPSYKPPKPSYNSKPAYKPPAPKPSYGPPPPKPSKNPPSPKPSYGPPPPKTSYKSPAPKPSYGPPPPRPSYNPPAPRPSYNPPVNGNPPKRPSYAPPTQPSSPKRPAYSLPVSGGRGTPRPRPQTQYGQPKPPQVQYNQQPQYNSRPHIQQTGSGAGRGPPTQGPAGYSPSYTNVGTPVKNVGQPGSSFSAPPTSNQWNRFPGDSQVSHPTSHNTVDPSLNQIPGSNQWNQLGPSQTNSKPASGLRAGQNGQNGQITFVDSTGQLVPGSPGLSSPLGNNPDDSMSSVSTQSKVVVVPPAGMMEDDTHKSISPPKKSGTHPAAHGEGQRRNPGVNGRPTFASSQPTNSKPSAVVVGPSGSATGKETSTNSLGANSNGQFGNKKPGRKPPKPAGPPPRRRPGPSFPTATPRPVRRKTPRPVFNNANRPNQVSIDVPAFSPAEKAVNEPLWNGVIPREPYVQSPTPSQRNPNKGRKTHGGVEVSASVIQGDNQIIGSGPGIVVDRPRDGYMRDVTITGPDGRPVVIQTRQEVVPQIDPSFTVSAGYPAFTDVYTIDPTAEPSFVSVPPSTTLEYQGWLTDGDPLAGLPPLRPTTTTSLDFTIRETEAPKTVTYQNEWNTPGKSPTADFRPHRPPPPNSNFANEFTALNFAGEVESIPVSVIRPTSSYSYSSIQRTEAPKTVTYENEWFANGNAPPSSVPEGSNANVGHPTSHGGRRPGQFGNRIRQPTESSNKHPTGSSGIGNGIPGHPLEHASLPAGVQETNSVRPPVQRSTLRTTGRPSVHRSTARLPVQRTTGRPSVQRTTGRPSIQRTTGRPSVQRTTPRSSIHRSTGRPPAVGGTVRPLVRHPSTGGNKLRWPGQGPAKTDDPAINTEHPSSHGIQRPIEQSDANNDIIRPGQIGHGSGTRHPSTHGERLPGGNRNRARQPDQNTAVTGIQNGNRISQTTPKGNRVRNPTRRRPLRPVRPIRPQRPVAADKIDVEEVATGEILGENQWNTFSPSDPNTVNDPEDKTTYQLEDGSIVRIPISRPGRPTFQRPPYRQRQPTEPNHSGDAPGLPIVDPTKDTFFDGSFVGQPTPEIINGNVRDPPRPPPTQEGQTYDPIEEYEDTFPNIEVSSDGYNGFNDVGNNGNNEQNGNNGRGDGNVGGGGYPGVGSSSGGASGVLDQPGDREGPTRRPYKSSEYVNEVRYPPRPGYEDGERSEGEGNFLKIPVDKSDKNPNIFAPTRETPLSSGGESGRKSDDNGEIDLTGLFGPINGGEGSKKKRKFETSSSSTRTTFSTNGKPTFINIDNTASFGPNKERGDEEDTGQGSIIITAPTKGTETSPVSLINPVKSTDFNQATTSAVSLKNEDGKKDSLNVFKFPQRPKPQPNVGAAPSFKHDDNIRDNEVIHNNLGAAIVEQVPGNILSAEDQDPETRCQKACADNEMCQTLPSGDTACRCRPGFGKRTNLPDAQCEKSKMYQIEVLTTSESQETRIVRFNPQAVQRAVEDSLKNKIQDLYHSSEVTSIKVSNNTKRNFALENEAADRDSTDNMKIKLLVEVRDESSSGKDDLDSIRSLESTLKNTDFELGSDVMVSRVSIDDFDECSSAEYNDCSDRATCRNTKGSYTCSCMPGYLDLAAGANSGALPGRVCSGASTECELCNRNGQCVLEASDVSCNCNPWFAGKNCQINLKLLLIVGAVSVCLMMIIACGVSCFCCKDRRKKNIPHPYGVSMARLPPHVRGQGLMMDPTGTVKSAMSGRSRQGKSKRSGGHGGGHSGHPHQQQRASSQGSVSRAQGTWQDSFGSVTSRGSQAASGISSVVGRKGKPNLVIPRAKVTPSRSNNGYNNNDYHSDDDRLSSEQPERNRAISEVASLASRHRRRSVPSFASGLLSGRSRREGSIDPLLEGFQSDGGDSGGRQSNSTFHRSVSRGDFDALDRAETRSVARSYNETIIRPVTRRLQSAAGTSYRSNGSTRTGSQDGRNAEKDGGSSFVVSPQQQLYRLHDSDGSFESL